MAPCKKVLGSASTKMLSSVQRRQKWKQQGTTCRFSSFNHKYSSLIKTCDFAGSSLRRYLYFKFIHLDDKNNNFIYLSSSSSDVVDDGGEDGGLFGGGVITKGGGMYLGTTTSFDFEVVVRADDVGTICCTPLVDAIWGLLPKGTTWWASTRLFLDPPWVFGIGALLFWFPEILGSGS